MSEPGHVDEPAARSSRQRAAIRNRLMSCGAVAIWSSEKTYREELV
jgi:hypothetical protein